MTMLDRKRRVLLVLAALMCVLGAPSTSTAIGGRMLSVRNGWCLPARLAANAAGYFVIDNKGVAPDLLAAVTSSAAKNVSIHESRTIGGVATMRSLRSVAIPARTAVTFAPGGFHLMLEHIRRPLKGGDTVPVTLWFKSAGPIRVNLVVDPQPPTSALSRQMPM